MTIYMKRGEGLDRSSTMDEFADSFDRKTFILNLLRGVDYKEIIRTRKLTQVSMMIISMPRFVSFLQIFKII